jgi:hypothetical protein
MTAEQESRMEDRAAEWIYSEPVTFQDDHDPSDIYLKDGRDLRVSYGTVTWQEVQEWKPGRKLTLAYSPKTGCVLIDSETLGQLPVIECWDWRHPLDASWDGRHPLDLLLDQDLRLNYSTTSIVMAYGASIQHWQAEIDRLYNLYLDSDKVPASAKEVIRAERAAWEKLREAHALALGSLYSIPDGTMWKIKGNKEYHAFIRDQARRLQDMAEALEARQMQDMVEAMDQPPPLPPEPLHEGKPAAGKTPQETEILDFKALGAGNG